MAHGTHNDANPERSKSITSFKSSFWLVIILVGLFISALNFIKVMGHGEGEAKGEKTEMKEEKPAHASTPEAEHAKEAKGEVPAHGTPTENAPVTTPSTTPTTPAPKH